MGQVELKPTSLQYVMSIKEITDVSNWTYDGERLFRKEEIRAAVRPLDDNYVCVVAIEEHGFKVGDKIRVTIERIEDDEC